MKPKFKSDNLAWNFIGDQAVILTLGEQKYIHELNPTAAFIWRKCDGTLNADQIAQAMTEEFEITLDEARSDTETFLTGLQDQGLIDWAP
jgi:hypothetical protein